MSESVGCGSFETGAELLEGLFMRILRSQGIEPNAAQLREAAVEAGPEFERIFATGKEPVMGLDWKDGRFVIVVTEGGDDAVA